MRRRTSRRVFLPLALLAGLVVLAAGSAQATPSKLAPGHLDPTFGKGGLVITGLGSPRGARAVAIQRDGKIVAAGIGFTLVRYSRNGSLDRSFGSKGKVATSFSGTYDGTAWSLALQRDGKIIAAGSAWNGNNSYFALARYKPNGSLDRSFGLGGRVTTAFSADPYGSASASAVGVQPDGKIVAGGDFSSYTPEPQNGIALARYRSDGTLDPSFGSGGKVTTPTASLSSLALQRDGKIVVAGSSREGSQTLFALARYTSNGSLDPSFGSGGIATTAFGLSAGASAVLIQRNGKIIAAGWGRRHGRSVFALVRYTSNGSLDPSFGSGGKVRTRFGSGSVSTAAALQRDGKIALAGWLYKFPSWDFALARYRANGSLDPRFGTEGKVTTSFRKVARTPKKRLREDMAFAVAIQPDGKIVAAGTGAVEPETSRKATPYKFELARYLGAAGKRSR